MRGPICGSAVIVVQAAETRKSVFPYQTLGPVQAQTTGYVPQVPSQSGPTLPPQAESIKQGVSNPASDRVRDEGKRTDRG